MKNQIREILPENMRGSFDSIVEQKVLGAGRHISMIGDMIVALAERGVRENHDTKRVIEEIQTIAAFFIKTRGEASQAVSNAILLMINNIDSLADLPMIAAGEAIIKQKNNYSQKAGEAVNQVVEYAVRLAEDMDQIFVYDYSSTVEQFLRRLAKNHKQYEIYIAESRVIDGGRPFVIACEEAGHRIRFIPEAAMMYFLKDCQGVFMGAETFYPDGTGFNTTGSDVVGLICDYFHVPLYFLTPMIKLDMRPVTGGEKNLVFRDLAGKLASNWGEKYSIKKIDFIVPELVPVKSEWIRAFVTEYGVIPAGQLFGISMKYSRNLRRVT